MIASMSGTQRHTEDQPALFAPTLPPRAEMERAFFASDASYDGIFVTGVRTTGIFCRPSCRARKPLVENRMRPKCGHAAALKACPGEALRRMPKWDAFSVELAEFSRLIF